MNRTRLTLLAVFVALLAAMAGLGHVVGDPPTPVFGQASMRSMPTADDPEALSSTWYCAAGTAVEDGTANLTVVVGNPLDQARRGTVTWFPDEGEQVVDEIQVGPRDVVDLAAVDALDASRVSAVVELEGGGAVVEHRVTGPTGSDVAPCASAPSPTWYFANGETTRDSRQLLWLFNPFPDNVVVDISLATDDRRVAPDQLQGLPVEPGSSVVVNLGEHVRRREITSTSIVARSGRLVVDRVQRFDESDGRTGLSLALGAPAPADLWHFPDASFGDQHRLAWHVYNPGEEEAIVLLETFPDDGAAPEPLERTVPGRSQIVVGADELVGMSADAGFRSAVRGINDVPVVAELEITATSDTEKGWSSMLGATATGQRWLFPAGDLDAEKGQRIIVSNPSPGAVTMSVLVLAGGSVIDVGDAREVELPPSSRVEVDLTEIGRSAIPVLVEADGPVVVERQITNLPGERFSRSLGVPLG